MIKPKEKKEMLIRRKTAQCAFCFSVISLFKIKDIEVNENLYLVCEDCFKSLQEEKRNQCSKTTWGAQS